MNSFCKYFRLGLLITILEFINIDKPPDWSSNFRVDLSTHPFRNLLTINYLMVYHNILEINYLNYSGICSN